MQETRSENAFVNTPQFFLDGGSLEVSGDDEGWREEDGARVFRHEIMLGHTASVNHRGAKAWVPYAPKVAPLISRGITKLDHSGDVNVSVDIEPARYISDSLRQGRFALVIRARGAGKLKAIGVSWTATMITGLVNPN